MNLSDPLAESNDSLHLAPTLRGDRSPSAGSAGTGSSGGVAAVPAIPDHELLQPIGRGSYGEVWLARNVLGECRAVKIVHRQTFESARPFDREFEGIKKFEPISRSHESQVQILHVGRAPDDSCFYYIMELADDSNAEGGRRTAEWGSKPPRSPLAAPRSYSPKTLRSEIQTRGRLPFEECLEIALKLTRAIGHLHQHGLVHRDIKPSNIIFVNGIPKLADIGLVARADATLSFVGTEGFLPPEGPGKPQADLYSFGKVLYEICTGRDRQDFPELPTDLRAVSERDQLIELNEIVLKACEPNLERRYRSAEEMHADLVLLQAGKSLKRLRSVERHFRELTRAAIVLVVLAVVVTAGFLYQRRQTGIVAAQRERAESALTQMELVRVSEMLERDEFRPAVIQLARMLRVDPANRFAAERLMAAINQRNFLLPLAGPLQHKDHVNAACFSPDGRWIATASKDGTARVWSATSGEPLTVPLEHGGPVRSINFSPDSHGVVTTSDDGTAIVWSLEPGPAAAAARLEHDGQVGHAEFSPDGKRILTVSGLDARVWDAQKGQMVGDVIRHEDPPVDPPPRRWASSRITVAHFSPDGERVATASNDGSARIWDASTGKALTPPMIHDGDGALAPAVQWVQASPNRDIGTMQFSPDGRRLLTASKDRTARIWDAFTGVSLGEPIRHEWPVNFAVFSPDGRKVLTGANDRIARIWDTFTGLPLIRALEHTEAVEHGRFSPDGRWILTSEWHQGIAGRALARMWDAETGELLAEVQQAEMIGISPDGQRVLTGYGRSCFIWDALSSAPQPRTFPHSTWVVFANTSADGELIVTAESAEISTPVYAPWDWNKPESNCAAWIWNLRSGRRVAGPLQHARGITAAAFSPDGKRLVTASRDQTARIWDVATGQVVSDPLEHPQIVRFARFTPDGRRVITACWLDRAWLWDAATGKMILEFHDSGPGEGSNNNMPVRSEDLSADGRWLATCSRDGARVWEVATGELVQGPFARGENIRAARFNHDGTRLVTAAFEANASIWDVQSGKKIAGPLRHDGVVLFAGFSPNGRKVVTCSLDRTARLWDAETGEALGKPLVHKGEVLYAEFSRDNRRLVTASWWDRAAFVWDVETGLPLSQPLQHDDWVNYASFSPDGRWVISASKDRTAKIWEIPLAPVPVPDWLPELAEALVGRRLNPQGLPESVPVKALIALRHKVNAITAADDCTRWAKWLFADRSQRTISPFSTITAAELTSQERLSQ